MLQQLTDVDDDRRTSGLPLRIDEALVHFVCRTRLNVKPAAIHPRCLKDVAGAASETRHVAELGAGAGAVVKDLWELFADEAQRKAVTVSTSVTKRSERRINISKWMKREFAEVLE